MAAALLARQGSEAETEADIRIRIRAGVVEVQRGKASIARVIPIPAAKRHALTVDARPFFHGWAFAQFNHPPIMRPSSASWRDQISYWRNGRNVSSCDRRT